MKKIYFICALGMILAFATSAQAITIVPNDGWHDFYFEAASGWVWSDSPGGGPISFEFTLPTSGTLKVTDAFWAGDRFTVSNNASPLGDTSIVATDKSSWTNNPDVSFADSRWSHASFLLAPGNYVITGLTYSPFANEPYPNSVGSGFLEVVTPVPASALLMFSGLLGLVGWRRFRQG